MKHDFTVHGRLKNGPFTFQFFSNPVGVYQVSVVGDGEGLSKVLYPERLGIDKKRRSCRRIAYMAQGNVSFHLVQDPLVKDVRHQAHGLVLQNTPAIRHHDPCTFLPPVLQGVESEIGQFGRLFMAVDGKYTTCDAEHPHYYIALTRAVSIPDDKIVSGPAYIVLEDVPLPLGIPFGFFPSTQTNQSGFILPTYGEEERRGFYLRGGGFYFALSDYFDLSLRGDVYTNGTWGVRTRSNYKKNYKFNGSFGINYMENVIGEKGLEDYSKSRDVAIRWSHGQDSRANPNQSFRASVDFTTSSYDQNHSHNINNVLRSTKRSSVSYSRVFPNSPFNLSASMSATQNSQTKLMDLNLPSVNFSMNRIYPLKRRNAVGSPRWYEKFQVSYTAQLENRLSTITDSLFTTTRAEDFENGYSHNIPASLALNFLNYFTFSPSVRYSGVVFTKSINPQWIEDYQYPDGRVVDTLIVDTIPGFNYAHAAVPSVGLTFTPRIYGMYTFRENSRIEAIRHVVSPSASFSLVPDMSGIMPNYYQEVQIDTTGRTRIYPLYDESVFRVPVPSGRSGSVSLSLKNNVEMKLKPKSDTIDDVRAAMLESLGVALHAVDLAGIRVSNSVAILGAGPIGLLILRVVRLAGADPVFISDKFPWRLALAEKQRCIPINCDEEDVVQRVRRETHGRGVDVAIEVAWGDHSVEQACDITCSGARVVLVGIPSDDRLSIQHSMARRKGLTIMMNRRMKHVYPRAIRLVERGMVDLSGLASHHFPLARAAEAFALNARYGDNVVKVMIES